MRLLLLLACACSSKEEPRMATIGVAGTQYQVKSAVASGTHIALSTGAMDCANVSPDADVILSRGTLGWTLGGKRFSQIHTAKLESMAGATLDVSRGAITLGGSGTIGGNAIELAGRIHVVECPPE